MGEEVSLARKETERRSVLLARARIVRALKASSCRDKREKDITATKGCQSKPFEDTAAASKDNAVAEGGDGEKPRYQKSRGLYQVRRRTRGFKGQDTAVRRSAKELGIEWYSSSCDKAPSAPHAHYWRAAVHAGEGDIYFCHYCHRARWMPSTMSSASTLYFLMRDFGLDEGYRRMLDMQPEAMRLVAKVKDIYLLEKKLPVEKLAVVVAAVLAEKETVND